MQTNEQDMRRKKTIQYSGFGFIFALSLTTILWSCASSGPLKTSTLNPCSSVTDNQKAIERIEAQEKTLRANMNDSNKTAVTAELQNLQAQIKGINASNATEMQNCEPTDYDDPEKK
jgi:hypothetical protein